MTTPPKSICCEKCYSRDTTAICSNINCECHKELICCEHCTKYHLPIPKPEGSDCNCPCHTQSTGHASQTGLASQTELEKMIERCADIEHTRWSKWQEYFFSKCTIDECPEEKDAVVMVLDKADYDRWKRQIATPYTELSEQEKESDRREVRGYLPLVEAYTQTKVDEALREERERVWNVAGEHRYQYEEDGELDRFSQGANTVVKAIWKALGGKPDKRGIWKM